MKNVKKERDGLASWRFGAVLHQPDVLAGTPTTPARTIRRYMGREDSRDRNEDATGEIDNDESDVIQDGFRQGMLLQFSQGIWHCGYRCLKQLNFYGVEEVTGEINFSLSL